MLVPFTQEDQTDTLLPMLSDALIWPTRFDWALKANYLSTLLSERITYYTPLNHSRRIHSFVTYFHWQLAPSTTKAFVLGAWRERESQESFCTDTLLFFLSLWEFIDNFRLHFKTLEQTRRLRSMSLTREKKSLPDLVRISMLIINIVDGGERRTARGSVVIESWN